MPREKAIEFIRAGSGTQFDPRVVEAFIAILPDVEAPRLRADEAAALAMPLPPEAAVSGRGTGEPRLGRAADSGGGRSPGAHAAETQGASEAAGAGPAVLTGASRALEQIARAHQETMALCELTELIVARPDLGRTLERVAGIVAKLVPYATLAVFLVDESGRMLEPAHVAGVGGALFAGMTLAVGEGVSGWVVEQNEAAVNALPMLDVARRCRPGDAFPLGAALSVPLRADGQVIGALTLYHAERGAYQSHHVRRLTRVAERVAPALESARQFARTRRLALEDSVTRIPNARALMQFLHQQCAQSDRNGRSFAVLMLDLDQFKGVNDTLGHLEGDAVLEQVASRLRECVRPMDYVARYAGDEFVVVLPGADGAAAARVADRVRMALDRLPAGSLPMAVGASIGAGCWPRDGREPRALLAAADARMFQDKAVRKRRLLGGSPE
jgi:two-component system cell cycle response regulator